jgi:hypothetical protein
MSANPTGFPPRYLRTPEAARFVGLSGRTLEKHRTYGAVPRYSKLGGRVVYAMRESLCTPSSSICKHWERVRSLWYRHEDTGDCDRNHAPAGGRARAAHRAGA